jgi:Protein of unknown function (DUF3175)
LHGHFLTSDNASFTGYLTSAVRSARSRNGHAQGTLTVSILMESAMARTKTGKRRARGRGTSRHGATRRTGRRWSRKVTEQSDALTLRQGVFTLRDPKRIAASLKRSAERSRRRKADPYRSALSMLTFYINRAGTKLPGSRRRILTRAKDELRRQFGRD